jgi:membrane-bound serine protease (ClpP class)
MFPPVTPNAAFLLLISGLLALYCELIWPGRIVPGVLGAAAALAGAWFLFRPPFHPAGLTLLAAAAVLLACEALTGPPFLPGILGTLALAAGFVLLLPPPRTLAPAAALPISVLFGAVSTLLARTAKRARRNKTSDLSR